MIDTERGSGDLYGDLFDYDIITLEAPFKPDKYIEAIRTAEAAGYDVIIIDSLSHAWSDEGGLLDQADKKSASGANRFTLWAELTPQHNALVKAMLTSPKHIIATMRTKQAYLMEEYVDNKGGKKQKPVKMGLAPIQREGMDYEFTVMFDIDQNHNAHASKDRTNMFKNEHFIIDSAIGKRVYDWLMTGTPDPNDIPLTDEQAAELIRLGNYCFMESFIDQEKLDELNRKVKEKVYTSKAAGDVIFKLTKFETKRRADKAAADEQEKKEAEDEKRRREIENPTAGVFPNAEPALDGTKIPNEGNTSKANAHPNT